MSLSSPEIFRWCITLVAILSRNLEAQQELPTTRTDQQCRGAHLLMSANIDSGNNAFRFKLFFGKRKVLYSVCILYPVCIFYWPSRKRRASNKNMSKFCLFYSQNNKILWWPNMAETFQKFTRNAKVCGHLVLDCTRSSCADWLSRQAPITWALCFEQLNQIWHKLWWIELDQFK